MPIERVDEVTPGHVAAINRLLPQLSADARQLSLAQLQEVVSAPGNTLLVARDAAGDVVGMLTLVVYPTPNKLLSLIEDVVVDKPARGNGIGEALVAEALRLAADLGASQTDLLSHDRRAAAVRLYQRAGFERFETNVFRYAHHPGNGPRGESGRPTGPPGT
jgi:ribosomal protein S18 acetylase RimI-like enzyme